MSRELASDHQQHTLLSPQFCSCVGDAESEAVSRTQSAASFQMMAEYRGWARVLFAVGPFSRARVFSLQFVAVCSVLSAEARRRPQSNPGECTGSSTSMLKVVFGFVRRYEGGEGVLIGAGEHQRDRDAVRAFLDIGTPPYLTHSQAPLKPFQQIRPPGVRHARCANA